MAEIELDNSKKYDRFTAEPFSKTEGIFSVGQQVFLPIKRLYDILFSSILLIALFPVFFIVSMRILLGNDGPVFFCQQRVGKNGKYIKIFKFRTMSSKAPASMPTAEFENSDQYITKFGEYLRKTSIDEIPQFFNVLKGDMSLVGPRPLIPNEKDIHSIRMQRGVYSLKPGITGLAQVKGRDLLTNLQKVKYDELYLHKFGLILDAKILLRSFETVFSRKGQLEGHQKAAANDSGTRT